MAAAGDAGHGEGTHISNHREPLEKLWEGCPWREVVDEFSDPKNFHERHYKEFITFLPYVQRFLYGESTGRVGQTSYGASPIRVFRRHDIAEMRLVLHQKTPPLLFQIAHVDLYFFHDILLRIWREPRLRRWSLSVGCGASSLSGCRNRATCLLFAEV